MSPREKLERLKKYLRFLRRAIVAFSGGVDSTFLASVAYEELGDGAVAVTADSPSIPRSQLEEARLLAAQIGIRHIILETQELDNPEYASNPTNRCYFCKSELFGRLKPLARELGIEHILYGAITDDRGDFRPGQMAASEEGILAPLDAADLSKLEIRELSRERALPTWEKPSSPCLSSRFPYGAHITREKLAQVEAAEELVRGLGLREFRVRHLEESARLELAASELAGLGEEMRTRLIRAVESAGFKKVMIDPEGFRSGRLNEKIDKMEKLELVNF